MAELYEIPLVLICFVGVGEIGIIPIHPLAQPDGLLCLPRRHFFNSFFALFYKIIYAKLFNIFLPVFESQLFFNFALDPKALRIKAILPADLKATCGMPAQIEVPS